MTLEQCWHSLWTGLGAQGDAQLMYDHLVADYSKTPRVYHTLQHIKHCLVEFDDVRDLATHPGAIELALWYHDAMDTEEASALLAANVTQAMRLSHDFSMLVMHLIQATKHKNVPTDFDTKIMVDIDLSILGQPEARFDEYERQIRQEYAHVPDHVFAVERSKLLRSFLARPTLYSTEFFRDKYEAQARRNLKRSLQKLSRNFANP